MISYCCLLLPNPDTLISSHSKSRVRKDVRGSSPSSGTKASRRDGNGSLPALRLALVPEYHPLETRASGNISPTMNRIFRLRLTHLNRSVFYMQEGD